MEAKASAFYFHELFDENFYRAQERWSNAALNYGYAVLRGAIARGLVAHGFLPSIGLFHHNEQNAFNLADDLIEPFRPIVDLHVGQRYSHTDSTQEFTAADKAALVSLLNVDLVMPRGTMSVLAAIEHCIESLARVYEGSNDDALELPELTGLNQHVVEG
jgi:CRISPR-associated protein Cas1